MTSVFEPEELDYLAEPDGRLARVATLGRDGMPHVVPTGWRYNAELDTVDLGGIRLARTRKFRDVLRTGRAAVVIDEVLAPWRPRGIEIRGAAHALAGEELIRIRPRRIVSWGLVSDSIDDRHARTVSASAG